MKNYLIMLLFAVAISATAQDKKGRPTSYNYMRGVEAVQNEKTEEALEFFNKDIQENPKNGYSYSWIAMLREHQEEHVHLCALHNRYYSHGRERFDIRYSIYPSR